MRKFTWFIFIVDIIIFVCFFVVYGPFKSFRESVIATALTTKTHQWIAYTFYSEKTVAEVESLTSYIPLTDDVNLDDIVIDTAPKTSYDNKYDEAVLTREAGNNDYKLINTTCGDEKAYIVAIYDPSKVKLIASKAFNTGGTSGKAIGTGQETVTSICKRVGGLVCINGGRFKDYGYGSDIPVGFIIKDSKIIWSDSDKARNFVGFNKDNKLVLAKMTAEDALKSGIRDGLEFGPALVVNGESIKFNPNATSHAKAARVAIAQRKDGIVLFLVTEGRHNSGPTIGDVADTLKLYGAYNASNLDGGTSTQLVIKNQLVNHPVNVSGVPVTGGRRVVSGFGLIP